MNNCDAINTISPFNMDVLMQLIANNDQLIRRYHEKCAETSQIQQNYDSITESAQQIQQLYASEKVRREQLQAENTELRTKLHQTDTNLQQIANDRINTDTLNKQTIAELEEKVAKCDKKYLDLCKHVVEQANILHANNLLPLPLMRRCAAAKEKLQSHGIAFEWNKSPTKSRTKTPNNDKVKCTKTTRTFGTQTDPLKCDSVAKKTPATTCDKSTQYQQSKTTRSTCTSAFIHKTDSMTNTDDGLIYPSNMEVVTTATSTAGAFVDSVLFSKQLSTIASCTQTITPIYRTQGTLTNINNVRKNVDYVRKSISQFASVKKEECASPCPSPGPTSIPSNVDAFTIAQNDPIHLTSLFHNTWQTVGDLLCRIAGQANMHIDDKRKIDMLILQKICEIKNLFVEKAIPNPMVPAATAHNLDEMNDDSNSRDSIESYSSAKVVISSIRNFCNCSPMPDENLVSEASQTTFKPILCAAQTPFENELQRAEVSLTPPVSPPNLDDTSEVHRNRRNSHFKGETVYAKPKPLTNNQLDCGNNSSGSLMSKKQVHAPDDVHFKVPKRKIATVDNDPPTKKTKSTKVSKLTRLFLRHAMS